MVVDYIIWSFFQSISTYRQYFLDVHAYIYECIYSIYISWIYELCIFVEYYIMHLYFHTDIKLQVSHDICCPATKPIPKVQNKIALRGLPLVNNPNSTTKIWNFCDKRIHKDSKFTQCVCHVYYKHQSTNPMMRKISITEDPRFWISAALNAHHLLLHLQYSTL